MKKLILGTVLVSLCSIANASKVQKAMNKKISATTLNEATVAVRYECQHGQISKINLAPKPLRIKDTKRKSVYAYSFEADTKATAEFKIQDNNLVSYKTGAVIGELKQTPSLNHMSPSMINHCQSTTDRAFTVFIDPAINSFQLKTEIKVLAEKDSSRNAYCEAPPLFSEVQGTTIAPYNIYYVNNDNEVLHTSTATLKDTNSCNSGLSLSQFTEPIMYSVVIVFAPVLGPFAQ